MRSTVRRAVDGARSKGARTALLLVALLAAATPLFAGAPAAQAQEPRDGRVLLVSLPGLTWSDVEDHDLPVLEAFLEDAAVANHATRGAAAVSSPGGAYLTISAGARATGQSEVDGQQLDLEDRKAGSAAGEIFQRRTGVEADGDYVALAWPELLRENAAQPYDAELGLLSETLAEEGLGAGVIANADGTDTVADSYERQAGLGVVTEDGVVPSGDLDVDLLTMDIGRPFGRRLDPDRVVERFDEEWSAPGGEAGGLVLVEASDMARTLRYRNRVDSARYDDLWAETLDEADELLGELLTEVDPSRDSVLVLAPYNLRGNRNLTVAALRAPQGTVDGAAGFGDSAGYLRSASTQRSGFVTLVDIAPTVLDLLDVERPVEMEGRPFEIVRDGTSVDGRVDRLADANHASRFREQLLVPTTLVIVVALAIVGALAIVALARPSGPDRFVRAAVSGGALFTLAIFPMSYVANIYPLEDKGLGFYWTVVLTGALAVAVVATLVGRVFRRPRLSLIAVLIFTAAVPAFDVMNGSNLSLSAAFGYSPTGNSRLYGISNYALGAFGASMSLLAAMLASRGSGRSPSAGESGGSSEVGASPDRRYQLGAVAVMLSALAVIGVPVWGANVGGILSFAPVVVLFVAVLFGFRMRIRAVLAGLAVTAAAVTVFASLDLARPPEQRAHLGRLVERVSDDGLGPLFSIMERKGLAAIEVTLTSFWTAGVLVGVVVWLTLRSLPGQPLQKVRERIRAINAGLAAAVLAAVFGSIMNDSGSIVGGTAMLVVVVVLVCLSLEPESAGRLVAGTGEVVTSAAGAPNGEASGGGSPAPQAGPSGEAEDPGNDSEESEHVESPA